MSSDIAIKVENLSKCYQIYDQPQDRLKQFLLPRIHWALAKRPRNYFHQFWALKDVSFEVKKGETVGIIGRNGSGKSTLLQLICGTLNPTSGSITTNGRIAALLELGSGFNTEFTGRENVYLNAALLGLTVVDTDKIFDQIASFADIGEFIDQPVKTYSSGMMVRLAFAVQAQVSPDILIVDEALAVGDAKFQAKCFERLKRLKDDGTSILLVTHSSEQIVAHCSRALLLDYGLVKEAGEPKYVVNRYMDIIFGKEPIIRSQSSEQKSNKTEMEHIDSELNFLEDVFHTRTNYNPNEYRWGDGAATILDFNLVADAQKYPTTVSVGQCIKLHVAVKFNTDLAGVIFGITIKTKEGVTVYGTNTEMLSDKALHTVRSIDSVILVDASFICRLGPGDYFVSLGLATKNGQEIIPHDRRYDAIHFVVLGNSKFFGYNDLETTISVRGIAP